MFFQRKKRFEAPNLLKGVVFSSKEAELGVGALFLFAFFCVLFLFPLEFFSQLGLGILAVLFLVGVFIRIEWGIYALGIFAFFHGWEVAFSNYHITRNIVFLNSINAPIIDFIALLLLPCSFIAFLLKMKNKTLSWSHLFWPSFFYACFLFIAIVSAKHSITVESSLGIKNIFRPLLFIFLSYILLPHFFIQSEIVFKRFISLWFWIGCAVALFGLSSLFFVSHTGWLRIVPYSIGSFAPLGINHNLLAQVLVAILPLGFWLVLEKKEKNWYVFGTGLILLVALGTLSRAAWLSLFAQMLAFFFLFQNQFKSLLKKLTNTFLPLFLLVGVIVMYMVVFLNSSIVASSDNSRLEVTKIVWFYAKRAPLLGYGPGSFIPIIQDTYVHTIEFGEALDAHGMIQKVLLEDGVLGLLFFGLFLISVLFLLYKSQKENEFLVSKFMFIMAVGVIVFQFFDTSYFNSIMWMPLGVALVSVGLFKNKKFFK